MKLELKIFDEAEQKIRQEIRDLKENLVKSKSAPKVGRLAKGDKDSVVYEEYDSPYERGSDRELQN